MFQTKTLRINFSGTLAIWQKKITSFLNTLVPTTYAKVESFWDGQSKNSLNLAHSYKKIILNDSKYSLSFSWNEILPRMNTIN